jgi:hypothetical protein
MDFCSGILIGILNLKRFEKSCQVVKTKKLVKSMFYELLIDFEKVLSGGEGIRTLDRISPIHTFQACQFNHSCTPPKGIKNKPSRFS